MVMRFYWGLGVGHVYSHQDWEGGEVDDEDMDIDTDSDQELGLSMAETGALAQDKLDEDGVEEDGVEEDVEENIAAAAELSLEDRETDPWLESEEEVDDFSGLPDIRDDEGLSSEEELEQEDMYVRRGA